ncbi:Gamma-interferon-responsive lysosomal thiol protein [Linum perenne]
MASSSSKSVSSLLFIAAILISVALFPSPCHCSSSDHHQKVNLSVYYETLCPPCAQFIVENLINIFNNGIIDIVNLKLIPWGNAHLTVNGTNNTNIICQVLFHSSLILLYYKRKFRMGPLICPHKLGMGIFSTVFLYVHQFLYLQTLVLEDGSTLVLYYSFAGMQTFIILN